MHCMNLMILTCLAVEREKEEDLLRFVPNG